MMSDNFRQAAYSQETDVAVIVLLTFTSEDETLEPVRVCNVGIEKFDDLGENIYGVTSNGNRFLFLPFNISLPQDDKTGAVSAKLSIDNVTRELVKHARGVKKAINVNIQCVLSNNLDYIEMEYDNFKLTNVTYNAFTVEGDLSIDYLGLEPFPCGRFTPSGFPGLF